MQQTRFVTMTGEALGAMIGDSTKVAESLSQ